MREVILNLGRLLVQSELAALERTLDGSGDRITVSKIGEQQKFLAIDTAVIDGVFESDVRPGRHWIWSLRAALFPRLAGVRTPHC